MSNASTQTSADSQSSVACSSHSYNFSVVLSAKYVFKIIFSQQTLVLIESSEALPRAAGSARRARPPVSAGTSPPPAAAGDALETREGRRERGKVRARVDWLGAPPPAPPTAAAERRVAGRAAAGAADATRNECTLAPRLSGGRTSFGLEHPERPGTRK